MVPHSRGGRIQDPRSAATVVVTDLARDATQDILIRVITHLGSFRGDSRVQTWSIELRRTT